jgi:hypothetical protein
MNELVENVISDLRYIKKDWNESVEDDELRRGSTVLRRLLIDKELAQALRASGLNSNPMLEASTLDPIIKSISRDKIRFASAGGARYKGIELRGWYFARTAKSQKEIKREYERGIPSVSISIHDFVEAPCLILYGEIILRRQLIQYVAHKLGGAHTDDKRDRKKDRPYILMDKARKEFKLADKSLIYFELLSIGQALSASSELEVFMNSI